MLPRKPPGLKTRTDWCRSGSELRVMVSGNAAEHQLTGLEGSTTYTVTITSQLGDLESSPATTTFATGSGQHTTTPSPSPETTVHRGPCAACVLCLNMSRTSADIRTPIFVFQWPNIDGTNWTVQYCTRAEWSDLLRIFSFVYFSPGPGGDQDGVGDLQAGNVTPRTALLSWKPASDPVDNYRLTYQKDGQEIKVRFDWHK